MGKMLLLMAISSLLLTGCTPSNEGEKIISDISGERQIVASDETTTDTSDDKTQDESQSSEKDTTSSEKSSQNQEEQLAVQDGIKVVATAEDTLAQDSTWCPTFQLVWNDMKNEVVKQDITFMGEDNLTVKNLNKESFTSDMLSDEYYFKDFGLKTLELKERIEKGIKAKFNETSDILNDFKWDKESLNDPNNPNFDIYFFYAMLKREFEFNKAFEKLDNGTFGKDYSNVQYFGVKEEKDRSIRNQIEVLFYDSKDSYAVSLKTKSGDEVILYKSPKGSTFSEIYHNLTQKSDDFSGPRGFQAIDELKVPYINMDEKETYQELCHKPFLTADGSKAEIGQAVQTIKFELNEKGGKIKSEAAMEMMVTSAISPVVEHIPRYFYFDDTFAMFLKEEAKDTPYFGAIISDITKFQ